VYLLRYKRDGEWRVVVITDAHSVAHARLLAARLAAGRFVDGGRVSQDSIQRLLREAVGRILTLTDLSALMAGTKKPPAASVRRPRGAARLGQT
jgi:hypothetical protein